MKTKLTTFMFFTAIAIFMLGCSLFSDSGSGNPNNAGLGVSTFADTLAQVSCSTIGKCYGGDSKECVATVNELLTFASKLGISEWLSVRDISARETSGALVVDAEKASACVERLRSLSCLSGEVVTSPMDSADMLDPICSEVF